MTSPPSTRRIYGRHPREVTVKLLHQGKEITTITENISVGGLFARVSVPLPDLEEVTVKLWLPAIDEQLEAPAEVRWQTAEGVGLRFRSLRAVDVWAIQQLLQSLGFDQEEDYMRRAPS